jgi:hypothetical protein
MAQCTLCTAGLGIVTVYRFGHMKTIECPKCRGNGYTCTSCGGLPDRCKCDDKEKTDTPRKL